MSALFAKQASGVCNPKIYINRKISDLDFFPEEFFSVVHSPEVLVLSQQFNGGLRPVSVKFRHIQIVHKDYHPLAHRGTDHILSPFLQLPFYHFLGPLTAGLSGEVDELRDVVGLLSDSIQESSSNHRLSKKLTCLHYPHAIINLFLSESSF